MSLFRAVIKQELVSAKREKLPQLLLVVFLMMTTVSSFIGWSTHKTVSSVYNEALAQGVTTAPSPFSGISPLYYARNTVIYVVLIGALLAIIMGVTAQLRDRKARTTDLLLSRPIDTWAYLSAKLSGLGTLLAGIVGISAVISWLSIVVITGGVLPLGDTGRLLGFYMLSWVFLMPFVILGMLSGIHAKRETTALLVPIIIWSCLVFVLPQLGTAEHPTALLNPVPAVSTSSGLFFKINQKIFSPLSITEHFKALSGSILNDSQSNNSSPIVAVASMVGSLALSGGLLARTKRGTLRGELYE